MSIEDAAPPEISKSGPDGGVKAADALVVLGATLMPDGTPSPALARRIETAARLWHEGKAPMVVASGGGAGRLTEAAAMADWLTQRHGIPAAAVVREERSTDTLGNARETLALARTHGWRHLLIVTDALHLPRALWCFRRLGRSHGVTVTGAAAPPPPVLSPAWWAHGLREAAALVFYAWRLR